VRQRLLVVAVLGGLAAVVALVVVVLEVGVHQPSPPSLAEHPNPAIPGQILFVDEDGCIIRVAAAGQPREQLHCPGQGVFAVTWVDEDTAAFMRPQAGGPPSWVEIDLATRALTPARPASDPVRPPAGFVSPSGETVRIGERGEVWIDSDRGSEQIADFDVPRYRGPGLATWSPDGKWILLRYSPPRGFREELWIVSRDGKTRGTLARDVTPAASVASWWIDGFGYLPAEPSFPAKVVP
jgi:hypothetical protein